MRTSVALAFVCCQGADLITWLALHPTEMNPLVRAFGAGAVLVKLLVIFGLVPAAWAFRYAQRTVNRLAGPAVLAFGAAWGAIGAVSNLPIR